MIKLKVVSAFANIEALKKRNYTMMEVLQQESQIVFNLGGENYIEGKIRQEVWAEQNSPFSLQMMKQLQNKWFSVEACIL